MNIAKRSWTEEYYDAIEHYSWAPDRLGHLSDPNNPTKNRPAVLKRLRRIEEPLNHIMGLFFALAPAQFIHSMFAKHCNLSTTGNLQLLGRSVQLALGVKDLMQPDFAFDGEDCFLAIEAKIDSKSRLEQVVKYAALHWLATMQKPGRKHGLLFLSKEPQEKLFKEKFADWHELKNQAKLQLVKMPQERFRKMNDEEREGVIRALDNLKIGHLTFGTFCDELEQFERAAMAENNEVAERLYGGLLTEIKFRNLF